MIVKCVNKDKGAVVNKACAVGCIACGKCEKVCAFGAITIANNVSYIDAEKCKQLFAISDNEEPAVLIPIGYAADEPKEKKRKEMEEICKRL